MKHPRDQIQLRFKQIACSSSHLYGLDEQGRVWLMTSSSVDVATGDGIQQVGYRRGWERVTDLELERFTDEERAELWRTAGKAE